MKEKLKSSKDASMKNLILAVVGGVSAAMLTIGAPNAKADQAYTLGAINTLEMLTSQPGGYTTGGTPEQLDQRANYLRSYAAIWCSGNGTIDYCKSKARKDAKKFLKCINAEMKVTRENLKALEANGLTVTKGGK